MYYELIYESGAYSVANYADDEEALQAITDHVERAKAGIPATAASTERWDVDTTTIPVDQQKWAAERIVKVLVYDEHPADYADTAVAVSSEVANSVVADALASATDENGIVDLNQVGAALRASTDPVIPGTGPHESNYKMKEARELTIPKELR